MIVDKDFYFDVREKIKNNGVNQKQLAEKLNCSQQHVSSIMRGLVPSRKTELIHVIENYVSQETKTVKQVKQPPKKPPEPKKAELLQQAETLAKVFYSKYEAQNKYYFLDLRDISIATNIFMRILQKYKIHSLPVLELIDFIFTDKSYWFKKVDTPKKIEDRFLNMMREKDQYNKNNKKRSKNDGTDYNLPCTIY